MAIIEVEHLAKEYQLGQLESLKTTFLNQVRRLTGQPLERRALFKALDDVNFTIDEGEVVGIIGHNGAGKSTLLKLLANITSPTSGRIEVNGRIAPLIEVSAGFVPDLTGRENVYLNGSILGLSRKVIDSRLEEIVSFAEMSEFIDTPVKRYSSGMKVKLAFSVATSVDSDILIVDEVLAVGDLAFQRKCFDRMEGMITRQGKTVLLVSHNLRHVERLCSRVILLDHGRLIMDADPNSVCNHFYSLSDERIAQSKSEELLVRGPVRSSGEADLLGVEIRDADGLAVEEVQQGKDIFIHIKYRMNRAFVKPVFGLAIHTTDFIYLSNTLSLESITQYHLSAGEHEVRCRIRKFPFQPGVYALRTDLMVGELYSTAFRAENLRPFRVVDHDANRAQAESLGFIPLDAEWSLDPDVDAKDGHIDVAGAQS